MGADSQTHRCRHMNRFLHKVGDREAIEGERERREWKREMGRRQRGTSGKRGGNIADGCLGREHAKRSHSRDIP